VLILFRKCCCVLRLCSTEHFLPTTCQQTRTVTRGRGEAPLENFSPLLEKYVGHIWAISENSSPPPGVPSWLRASDKHNPACVLPQWQVFGIFLSLIETTFYENMQNRQKNVKCERNSDRIKRTMICTFLYLRYQRQKPFTGNIKQRIMLSLYNKQKCDFINTKKAFKKLYIFILRRFGLILIHLQSKK